MLEQGTDLRAFATKSLLTEETIRDVTLDLAGPSAPKVQATDVPANLTAALKRG
jgi:hypothetical protein